MASMWCPFTSLRLCFIVFFHCSAPHLWSFQVVWNMTIWKTYKPSAYSELMKMAFSFSPEGTHRQRGLAPVIQTSNHELFFREKSTHKRCLCFVKTSRSLSQDRIRRYGGSTSPALPWPEDEKKTSFRQECYKLPFFLIYPYHPCMVHIYLHEWLVLMTKYGKSQQIYHTWMLRYMFGIFRTSEYLRFVLTFAFEPFKVQLVVEFFQRVISTVF